MKRIILLLIAVAFVVTAPGCSCMGVSSQDELRRYAIKRKKDPEDLPKNEQPKPTPNNTPDKPAPDKPAPDKPAPDKPATNDSQDDSSNPTETVDVATSLNTVKPEENEGGDTKVADNGDTKETIADPPAPEGELSESQQRKIVIDRLNRIGDGMERYLKANKGYPPTSIRTKKTPLLSWRVALLPYLGYEELYEKFDLNAPWNHPTNEALLAEIPHIYRDPGRTQGNVHFTNFLAVEFGSSLLLRDKQRQVADVTDGIENTIMVLEANDSDAVPWTMPKEFGIASPIGNIDRVGRKRSDGSFVLWGAGLVSVIPQSTPDKQFFAAVTAESGDLLKYSDIYLKALADPTATGVDSDLVTVVDNPGGEKPGETDPLKPTPTDPRPTPSFRMPLYDYAARAMSESRVRDATRYLNGAMLLDESGEWLQRMKWCDGLRRPVADITWAFAATKRTSTDIYKFSEDGDDKEAIIRNFEDATGELGHRFVKQVYEFAERGKLGPLVQGGVLSVAPEAATQNDDDSSNIRKKIEKQVSQEDRFSRTSALFPGAVVFVSGKERALIALAKKREVDVLALFEITQRPINRNEILTSMRLKLIDAATGRLLHETRSINNVEIRAARLDPLKDDPTDAFFDQTAAWLREGFQRVDIPEALRSEHVRKRVSGLISMPAETPLRQLVELRYYVSAGYLTQKEYESAVVTILEEDASDFLSGDPEAKAKIVSQWMPDEYKKSAAQ